MSFFKALMLAVFLVFSAPAAASDLPSDVQEMAPAAYPVQHFPDTPGFTGGRRAYMWGNALAVTGAGLMLSGVGMATYVGNNCYDQGCVFAVLGVLAITWMPAMALIPVGEVLSVVGTNRMGVNATRIPHYVFVGGLATAATGFLLMLPWETASFGAGLLAVGGGVAITSALVQVVANAAAYRHDRFAGFSAAPTMVSRKTAGVALAVRF